MRPYLAIIYDSFIEAAQSKVLWFLLAAWTIVLAAVAPFSIIQGDTLEIQGDQILARQQLINQLTEASEGRGSAAQRAVWSRLDPMFQQQIVDRRKNQRGGRFSMGVLADGLNSVLTDVDLFSREAWPTAAKREDLKALVAKPGDSLTPSELQKRNRRLIELAFPGAIRSGSGSVVWIGYAGIKVSDPLSWSRKQIESIFEGVVLMAILKIGLGIVGIFVGIVVTSPMIPEMFQVGSLHLLLSKPISRTWLLISKFIGGTAFVALNVTYLLIGFFLLVGWRLDIWNVGILWCIPIFIFVFMIYYSVSVVAGLIWKNAIISVAIVALFWGFCTVIGITHAVTQNIVEVMPEFMRIDRFGQSMVAVTNQGSLQIWDEKSQRWQTAFGEVFGEESILGPFWIPSEKSLYFGRPMRIPMGGIQSDGIRLQIAKLPEMDCLDPSKLDDTPLWDGKRIDAGPEFPPRTRRAIAWEGTLVALTERGLFRLDLDAMKAGESSSPFLEWMLSSMRLKSPESYVPMTPNDWFPESPLDFCYVEQGGFFAVYSRGKLIRVDAEGESKRFAPGPTIDLDLPDGSLALVAANQAYCLVATNKSGLWRVDCQSWDAKAKVAGGGESTPRAITVSPLDGSFALLDRGGKIWRITADAAEATLLDLPHQGAYSAVSIDQQGIWWLAHHGRQVDGWDPAKKEIPRRIVPRWSLVERIHRWGIAPLYWVNPKPAAVDVAIQRSLTDEDPFSLGRETTELQIARGPREDLWQPIISNSVFIVCMLAFGCLLLHRQDL